MDNLVRVVALALPVAAAQTPHHDKVQTILERGTPRSVDKEDKVSARHQLELIYPL